MRFLPDGFRFESPHWLWLLALLPVLAVLRGAAGRTAAVRFSSVHLLRRLGSAARSAPIGPGFSLMLLSMAFGIVALARPQKVTSEDRVEESGVEIFLAIDVSLSMSIQDMDIGGEKVDRLTVAKKVARDFIKARPSDRIGCVVFAGRPYLAAPLTLHQEWLMQALERVGFNQTRDMGTAIGSALNTAGKRLVRRDSRSRIIILVTDGASNTGVRPEIAARLAATEGIKIYTVAIGTDGYHRVPVPTPEGFNVGIRQEFDEETLKEVAAMTGGRFYHARDGNALSEIFREIDQLEKTTVNVHRHTLTDELFHRPLIVAFLCGFAAAGLQYTVFRRHP